MTVMPAAMAEARRATGRLIANEACRCRLALARRVLSADPELYALATQQAYGIWGGTSEEERRRILARGSATPHPARTRLKTRAKSRMPVAPGWPR